MTAMSNDRAVIDFGATMRAAVLQSYAVRGAKTGFSFADRALWDISDVMADLNGAETAYKAVQGLADDLAMRCSTLSDDALSRLRKPQLEKLALERGADEVAGLRASAKARRQTYYTLWAVSTVVAVVSSLTTLFLVWVF